MSFFQVDNYSAVITFPLFPWLPFCLCRCSCMKTLPGLEPSRALMSQLRRKTKKKSTINTFSRYIQSMLNCVHSLSRVRFVQYKSGFLVFFILRTWISYHKRKEKKNNDTVFSRVLELKKGKLI